MFHSAQSIAERFNARYPNPGGDSAVSGVIPSINAGQGKADSIEAAAVRGFAEVSGKLQWVRATNGHFLHAGETIREGDFVQLQSNVADRLVRNGQAEAVSDDEVRAAQNEAAKAKK